MLERVVSGVIVPGYRDLSVKCGGLRAALEDLARAPARESLEKARHAWTEALLACRRIQWLQSGPIAEHEYIAAFYFAKVLPRRMDEILKSSRPVDEPGLAEIGAAAKGMFALEYLLFDRRTGGSNHTAAAFQRVLDSFAGAEGARRGEYALTLARDLEVKAGRLVADWAAPGDQGAGPRFVAGGQASLNRLVNEVAQAIEQVAEERISFVLHLPRPVSRQFDRVEGSASGTSRRSAGAMVEGVAKLFSGPAGGGLGDYLGRRNAPLAERIRRELGSAVAAVESIGAPLEEAVPSDPGATEKAYEKLHGLEVLFKADLASALGVTITFNSNDGD